MISDLAVRRADERQATRKQSQALSQHAQADEHEQTFFEVTASASFAADETVIQTDSQRAASRAFAQPMRQLVVHAAAEPCSQPGIQPVSLSVSQLF